MKDIKVLSTASFRLKEKPGREHKVFNLKSQFGFIPEIIIISKVKGSQRIILSAVVPQKERAKIITTRKETIPIKELLPNA